ncbi:MAG: SAM-dependent chlorinase/fluorinase [Nitrososphaeria archaeon]|jgi:S-adenosylmethionine hydrolase
MKRIIALLTDFGGNSIYIGEVKGVILGKNPNATIVDLSNVVFPQNVKQGAFLLKSAYKFFPKNSIFICVVDPGVGSDRRAIAVKTSNYFFIGPDNGLMSPAIREDVIDAAVVIENSRYILNNLSKTFHGREVFAPVAGYVSKGLPITRLGPKINSIEPMVLCEPYFEGDLVVAEVAFVDAFGNIVTNVTHNFLCESRLDSANYVRLFFGSRSYRLPLVESYSMVNEGSPLALFDSFECLEISVSAGNASKYFHIRDGNVLKFGFNN